MPLGMFRGTLQVPCLSRMESGFLWAGTALMPNFPMLIGGSKLIIEKAETGGWKGTDANMGWDEE